MPGGSEGVRGRVEAKLTKICSKIESQVCCNTWLFSGAKHFGQRADLFQ